MVLYSHFVSSLMIFTLVYPNLFAHRQTFACVFSHIFDLSFGSCLPAILRFLKHFNMHFSAISATWQCWNVCFRLQIYSKYMLCLSTVSIFHVFFFFEGFQSKCMYLLAMALILLKKNPVLDTSTQEKSGNPRGMGYMQVTYLIWIALFKKKKGDLINDITSSTA